MKKQGIRFQTRMLEIIRKYLWTPEKRLQLYKFIRLRPDDVVIDVGCGTGAYSRVVAQGLDHIKGGRLIGIDRNQDLLKSARRISKSAGFSKVISYKRGDALKGIPLPDNFADRVVCQSFLWLFDDENKHKVIKDMVRICKPNGTVAAVEGAVDTNVIYFEDSRRLSDLWRKNFISEIRGYRKIYGYDRNTGYKLPFYFKKAALKGIKVKVFGDAEVLSDNTVPLDHRLEMLRYWEVGKPAELLAKLARCKNRDVERMLVEKAEPVLIAGGMSYREIIAFNRLRKLRAENLLKNPCLLKEDRSISIGSGFLTIGVKS